jgi:hypothetical protein
MGDWTDLAGKLIDHAAILNANVENPQTTHNHVYPRAAANGVSDLRGWNSEQHHLYDAFDSNPREIPLIGGTLATPNRLTYGVSWRFGGQWQGHGRYVRDAFAWVTVHGIGAAQRFYVDAVWNDPEYEGDEQDPIGIITCDITVRWEQFYMTDTQWHLHFSMHGDGAGQMTAGGG